MNLSIFQNYYNNDFLAKNILGKKLSKWDLEWIINEIEIYKWADDPASHAFKWETNRNWPMFETWWHIYVYMIYGMYFCLNISIGEKWKAWAILIRWINPTWWIEKMKKYRKTENEKNLTNWPGKLCQAFWIDKSYNWLLLSNSDLEISEWINNFQVEKTSRVGIKTWTNKKWRYLIKNL